MEESERPGGGGVIIKELGCNGTWLFFKWSGVAGGDVGGVVGTRVGEEWIEEGGREVGSKSRSGMAGDTMGLRVTLSMTRRRITLILSITTMPLHLFFSENLRRIPISMRSWVKRMNSTALAAHL